MTRRGIVHLIRTLSTQVVIEVEDSSTEEDILEAARGRAASLGSGDFDDAENDADILALDLQLDEGGSDARC